MNGINNLACSTGDARRKETAAAAWRDFLCRTAKAELLRVPAEQLHNNSHAYYRKEQVSSVLRRGMLFVTADALGWTAQLFSLKDPATIFKNWTIMSSLTAVVSMRYPQHWNLLLSLVWHSQDLRNFPVHPKDNFFSWLWSGGEMDTQSTGRSTGKVFEVWLSWVSWLAVSGSILVQNSFHMSKASLLLCWHLVYSINPNSILQSAESLFSLVSALTEVP